MTGGGWNPMEHCDGSGRTLHVDVCPCPECSPEPDAAISCEPGCACSDPTLCGTATLDEFHVAQRDRLAQALRLLRDTTSEGTYTHNVVTAALTEARITEPEDDCGC